MRASSSTPSKPLLGKERYSNEEALKSSSGRGPVRLLCPALSTLSAEHLPRLIGMLPLNWLKDVLIQNDDGINPWKLLLLAFSTTKSLIFSHDMDGNSPNPAEVVETDINHDDASGGQQLQWKFTREGVVRQVEALKIGEASKGW
ncbi:hypothetical protein U9M48_025653 [Paspalum notatum var. saurae]|uniref:Uncharacterized protein n=1 Tax=Paspalum notatum var. saurae TaxID=547442 RepID=A0AAQ3TQV4_PASNO